MKRAEPVVAIQLDAVAFVDEGVEQVLDTVSSRAAVNTLALDVFWFSRETSGEALARERYRGHGARLKEKKLAGGPFGVPRSVPGLARPGPDVLAVVIKAARKRGMRFVATVKDVLAATGSLRERGTERLAAARRLLYQLLAVAAAFPAIARVGASVV